MFVERYGGGPRHFLGLPGWNGSYRTYAPIVRGLPGDVTFWSADLPGCGRSPKLRNLTLDAVLDDMAASLAGLPGDLTLVGNCSGAALGLLLIARAPERFRRLVMIDAFSSLPWYFKVFLLKTIGRYAYFTAFANPLGRWLSNAALRPRRAAATDLTGGFAHADHPALYAYLELFAEAARRVTFPTCPVPVDIFHGERTFAAVRESLPFWQSHLPVRQVECLRGAGHLPILEAPEQLREFLFQSAATGETPCPTIAIAPNVTRI